MHFGVLAAVLQIGALHLVEKFVAQHERILGLLQLAAPRARAKLAQGQVRAQPTVLGQQPLHGPLLGLELAPLDGALHLAQGGQLERRGLQRESLLLLRLEGRLPV